MTRLTVSPSPTGLSMSLQETKAHFVELLTDPDNKVIALSGKWGTGKSHLWREVQSASDDETVKGSVCVSLFGLSDIDQLKRKLLESVVPVAESHPTLWDGAKQAMSSGMKVLESFHKGFGAINDLSLLLAPAILRNKTIVIDDIERKHEKLSIDEILGFIDQYSQQYGSRFVLILNSDQLAQREAWDTLREKVIDQEIRLLTTPEEAFAIAIGLKPSRYSAQIKNAVKVCQLTNIRVIQRVIRSANRLLGERDLSDAILARVVPSIAILTAINYRGIEDGPDFQFVLAAGSTSDLAERIAKNHNAPDESEKRKARWRLLLQELSIGRCDEFEALVVQFLESGQFDASKVTAIVDRYIAEAGKMEAHYRAGKLLERIFWDPRAGETELIAEANELVSLADLPDPYTVTDLDRNLAQLPQGSSIGSKLVQAWISSFRAKRSERDTTNDDSLYHQPLHPDIKAEFAEIQAHAQSQATVFNACMHIIDNSGWGAMQEAVMKNATVQDFESTLRELGMDDFRRFTRRMLDMWLQRKQYESHFGSAMDQFVEACKNITNDPSSARLGALIKRLFQEAGIESELSAPAALKS